jgi:hypothetical protein
MWVRGQASLDLQAIEHYLYASTLQPPNIFTNLINFINPKQLIKQRSSPVGDRRFPLLTTLTPDRTHLVTTLVRETTM